LEDLILATKLLTVGETTNSTDRESIRSVVRCISNGVGLCNKGVKGKKLVGRRRKDMVNKQKGAAGVLEGALDLREGSERESAKVGGGQHNSIIWFWKGARDATVGQLVKQMWVWWHKRELSRGQTWQEP
jgi:hypothetical protein